VVDKKYGWNDSRAILHDWCFELKPVMQETYAPHAVDDRLHVGAHTCFAVAVQTMIAPATS